MGDRRRRARRAGSSAIPARALIAALRRELRAAGDPTRAAGMQAYMKSAMPYYGVSLPGVRAIGKRVFGGAALDCGVWLDAVLELWRTARFREDRYAAIDLLTATRYAKCLTPDTMPVLEEMIVTGAWWDYVDAVTHAVGRLLRDHPEAMKPLMRTWSGDADVWKRRVSIICQLGFKRDTDLELLYANIERNLADRDFFIRKAIGWALRQYAWTDPDEVLRYVRAHENELSALSKREALKNIG